MRFFLFVSLLLWANLMNAQEPTAVTLEGDAAFHQVSWTTNLNFNYQLEMSPDLENWVDVGNLEPGTGNPITYNCQCPTGTELFYRVREIFTEEFFVEPTDGAVINKIDGVCFAFNLNGFLPQPSKIRIYQRVLNSGNEWELIGVVTDFGKRFDEIFMRGGATWLPETQGDYEVRVDVLVANRVTASEIRQITVQDNLPPAISITSGPNSQVSGAVNVNGAFSIDYSPDAPSDNNTVRKIEIYDNWKLIGTSVEKPFASHFRDRKLQDPILLAGSHSIVMRAYDAAGQFSDSAPRIFTVTGVNARPLINVTAPADGLVVLQGNTFTIDYAPPSDPDGNSQLARVVASRFIVPIQVDAYFGGLDAEREEIIATDDSAPFGSLVVDTTGWDLGTYLIKVAAEDTTNSNDGFNQSIPEFFRIYVSDVSDSSIFASNLVAEIADNGSSGSLSTMNPQFRGRQISSDIFSSGLASGLQMDSGVLMTTGSFGLWNGGDNDTNTSDGADQTSQGIPLYSEGNYDLLSRVFDQPPLFPQSEPYSQDAAILEFDVFCENGQLEFEYQFSSEEYYEFVEQFNDTFVIMVDGAIVTRSPDCQNYIAVNTVNNGTPASAQIPLPPVNRHLFLEDDTDIALLVEPGNEANKVEYDGMTIALKSHVFVEPQSIHTVKILISDIGDGILDSGLFIRSGSVKTVNVEE